MATSGVTPFVYLLVALVHPLIHGTPLDGGALDAAIDGLRVWSLSTVHVHDQEV